MGWPGVAYTSAVPDYALLDPAVLPFLVLPALLATAFAWGLAAASRRMGQQDLALARALSGAAAAAIWMAGTWLLAAAGVLRRWGTTPPPFLMLVVPMAVLGCVIAFSPYGRILAAGLPLWTLVGVQGFRLPLELALHAMVSRGVTPEQMSYSGRNFDIVTGATAIGVAALALGGRAPRWL